MKSIMLRIGDGPPPEELLESPCRQKKDKFVWKTPHRTTELWVPRDVVSRAMDENADFLAFLKLEKRDAHHFGGTIRRKVEILKAYPVIDEDCLICPVYWEEILGAVSPWEAWKVCREWRMELQGIQLPRGDRLHRFYCKTIEPDPIIYCLESYEIADGQRCADETRFLLERRSLHVELEDDPRYQHYPKMFADELVSEGMIRTMLALEDLMDSGTEKGWSVAPVWRTAPELLHKQAALFDMTTNQLVTRLERRERASKRKGSK